MQSLEKGEGLPGVKLPNGASLGVDAKGRTIVSPGLELHDVLYIPSFTCNLVSVSKLTQQLNFSVTFYPSFCVIQDLALKKLIGRGELRDGLYYFKELQIPVASVANSKTSPTVWHQRLGHVPFSKFTHIPCVSNLSLRNRNFCCDACHRAKQTRKMFSLSLNQSENAFDLVHMDVWGPYKTASLSGAHYFLTIVDDFSRCTWIYLLKRKSEVHIHFEFFHALVKNQFGKLIKQVRCDNALELTAGPMLNFFPK